MTSSTPKVDLERVRVSFSRDTTLGMADDAETRGLYFWSVGIDLLDEQYSEVERSLGHATVVIVDSLCRNPLLVCDDESGDLSSLAAAVWGADGELSEDAAQVVDYLGQDVLLLDPITLEPDVRGHDIGLLAAAEIIRVLGRSCCVVATQGMPPGPSDLSDAERRRGSAALARHWRRLGLEPIPGHEDDGMLIGDLTSTAISDARATLGAHHGLK